MAQSDPEEVPLRLTVTTPDRATAEWVMAEAWSAGAVGVEERDEAQGVELVIYSTRAREEALRCAVAAVAHPRVSVVLVEEIGDEDWSEAWKAGLEAIVISDRLVVRPSFVEFDPSPGQHELIVDPKQAFGTGGHASTRLVLEWLADLAAADDAALRDARVLDVGTGSGVLALAALVLGADRAVGLDLDAVAVREAAAVAVDNGLADRLALYAGGIEAVCGATFQLVLANLLRSEMLPIAGRIAAAVEPGGSLVLSGLLERDGDAVTRRFGAEGLEPAGLRRSRDPSGEDWIAPRLRRPA